MFRVYFLIFALLAGSAAAETKQHAKPRKAAAKAVAAQPQPQPTPAPAQQPPPTPEQGPSSPPDVSFQSGRLTIVARNSTLGDVLSAVKQKTGASVDMPAVSSERVVGQFGPGAPRDVMAQLLNGSHYDYVLLGSPSDPGALKKVVLMARANGPEPAPAPGQNPGQNQRPGRQAAEDQQNLQAVPDAETDNAVEENSGEATPDASQQPQEEPQPEGQPEQQGEQPNEPMVKTPEQLLRELQQQQQQQQQNGPPGAPGQPPQ